MTRIAIPALDPHRVGLRRFQRLALIKPVTNQHIERVTLRTSIGTRKNLLVKTFNIRLDTTSKFGYNDHVLRSPTEGCAAKPNLRGGLFLS